MKPWVKVILFELWFLLAMPFLGILLVVIPRATDAGASMVLFGEFLCIAIWWLWAWQWYAYVNYRHCRQEEFLFLLQTAAATQAPIEQVLRAYLNDRPREHLFRAILLFFVFPGYYWVHITRSFDARLSRLMVMLERGLPLDEALLLVPGLASRETMLAAAVGQYSGKLGKVMNALPDGRSAPVWLDVVPRLMYPLMVVSAMVANLMFLMIFIIPKFEKIFVEFKMKLPYVTELVIEVSRFVVKYPFLDILVWVLVIGVINAWLFSSYVRWHTPPLNWLYRMKARGEFLQILGVMLETGRPLKEILENMLDSRLLPGAVQVRVAGLLADLTQGLPLADSLLARALTTRAAHGLIGTAQKANNLPWALQQIGDSLTRRSARLSYRMAIGVFPMLILVCAGLIAVIALAMFTPLTTLLGGLSGG
jgi:type II secretory pathway component PulF